MKAIHEEKIKFYEGITRIIKLIKEIRDIFNNLEAIDISEFVDEERYHLARNRIRSGGNHLVDFDLIMKDLLRVKTEYDAEQKKKEFNNRPKTPVAKASKGKKKTT